MQRSKPKELSGVVPIVPIPFDRHESIDEQELRGLVEFAANRGFTGICLPAYGSEFYKLSDEERILVVQVAVQQAAGRLLVVAQSNHGSSRVALRMGCKHVENGADVISVAVPRTFALNDDDLLRFLEPILNGVKVPTLVQDYYPTGTAIGTNFVSRLSDQCPSFQYLKLEEPQLASKVVAIRSATKEKIRVLEGMAGLYLMELVPAGIVGVMPGLAIADALNVVFTLRAAGKAEEAFAIYEKLLPFIAFSLQNFELWLYCEKRLLHARRLMARPHSRNANLSLILTLCVMLTSSPTVSCTPWEKLGWQRRLHEFIFKNMEIPGMKTRGFCLTVGAIFLVVSLEPFVLGQEAGKPLTPVRPSTATGPLRANPANPRYFTDGSGKAIYLTGSHTWANLMDRGQLNPPGAAFDYAAYMKWMVDHNFNFMRLWTAELPDAGPGPDYAEGNFVALPWKWMRTGPGSASDGGLKFDLTKLDQKYFDKMRARTIIAGQKGIYVSVMLFNGYEWQFDTNSKDGDPFVGGNNVNGIDCPGACPNDSAQMSDAVWAIETAYFRKVIDTVNDLDNVLYEVANEAGSPYSDAWQIRVIKYLQEYEASKPKRHPVGMTFQWQGGSDLTLYNSPADWISPGSHVPPSDGHKVIINDTDHAFGYVEFKNKGAAAQRAWVWENFTAGNNVAFMDPYLTKWPNRNSPRGNTDDPNVGTAPDAYWDVIRDAMGPTLTYANRMKLVSTKPQPTLSSTGFCLANPGTEYLVYQPLAKSFTLQLAPGIYQFEWFNPATNLVGTSGSITASGGERSFATPFAADAVLYLHATGK